MRAPGRQPSPAFPDGAALTERLIAARDGRLGLIGALTERERKACEYAAKGPRQATSAFRGFDEPRARAR